MDEFTPFAPSGMKEFLLQIIFDGFDVVICDLFPLLYLFCVNNIKIFINRPELLEIILLEVTELWQRNDA
jgi:hypothetical protein